MRLCRLRLANFSSYRRTLSLVRAKLAARAPRALRLLEPLAAAALGVASGIYIFDPALRAARDERERAAKAASGGSGSGGGSSGGGSGGGSGVGGADGSGGGGGGGGR